MRAAHYRLALVASLCLWLSPVTAMAGVITYVDADFEGGAGDLGGGETFPGFGTPLNVSPSPLGGGALEFAVQDQLIWERGALPESTIHRIRFDFFSAPNANVTTFLDVPTILRLDLSVPGSHHIDIEYDLAAQTAQAFLDGTPDNSLFSFLIWGANPESRQIRIANQGPPPGNSDDIFWIDNLVWTGTVPEPGTAAFLLLGVAGLAARRRFS